MTSQPVRASANFEVRIPLPLSPTPSRHPLLHRILDTPSEATPSKRRCVHGEDLDQKIRQTVDINQVFLGKLIEVYSG